MNLDYTVLDYRGMLHHVNCKQLPTFQRIIVPPSSESNSHTLLGLRDSPKKRYYNCLKREVPIYSQHCITAQKTWILIYGVPEDEGTMILQNIDDYIPWCMVCHPRRHKSSATLLWMHCPNKLHYMFKL
jgi:hypothetical protein